MFLRLWAPFLLIDALEAKEVFFELNAFKVSPFLVKINKIYYFLNIFPDENVNWFFLLPTIPFMSQSEWSGGKLQKY